MAREYDVTPDEFLERRIIIGLIISTDYLQEIVPLWNPRYIESVTARMIASWCIAYYQQYRKAPAKDIEGIFMEQAKTLSRGQIEDIEQILSGLSEEYDRTEKFNYQYLIDQTKRHFKEQNLREHAQSIQNAIDSGNVTEAENLALSFAPHAVEDANIVDPFESAVAVRKAFEDVNQPLIQFPKALGEFWNHELARDSFVALMGPEKRGKSFWLMELAMQGVRSNCNVIFFQAGDMSENQQRRRLYTYLAGRSHKPHLCTERLVPVVDCWYNQIDTCDEAERECDHGILINGTAQHTVTKEMLMQARDNFPEYLPCRNCSKFKGAVWLEKQQAVKPLTWKEAYKHAQRWKKKTSKKMKLATYPNETLSMVEIRTRLDILEKKEGFVPDVIIVDYADIMTPDPDCSRLEKREQINKLWQRFRRLSQERHCLVITATQAATTAYNKASITMDDFSDSKTKHAHVTATFSLNQTQEEKQLGIMRIGKLVVREDEFDVSKQVHVVQHLHRDRPFVGSYF